MPILDLVLFILFVLRRCNRAIRSYFLVCSLRNGFRIGCVPSVMATSVCVYIPRISEMSEAIIYFYVLISFEFIIYIIKTLPSIKQS